MVQMTEKAIGKVKEIMGSQDPAPAGLRIAHVLDLREQVLQGVDQLLGGHGAMVAPFVGRPVVRARCPC